MKRLFGLDKISRAQFGVNILLVVIGSIVSATGINAFLVPHKFLSGGVTGISQLLSYVSEPSVATYVLAFNVPIFVMGWFTVGRTFVAGSAIGMLTFSGALYATEWMSTMGWAPEPLLSAIIGGALSGGGTGLVLRANSSHGGMDIVAATIKKRWSVTMGTVSFIVNIVIVSALGAVFGLHVALYTIISYLCSALSLDRVMRGLDTMCGIFVVSADPERIAGLIMEKLGRGVTYLDGEGAYTGRRERVIYCVVTLRQLARVKHYVRSVDPKAFLTVADVNEVSGKGFKQLPV
ncbi:MAG: YitT family protein [Proteobacteria bacterium]|nr:YitT family protein [Pseudomonadota bacterium]